MISDQSVRQRIRKYVGFGLVVLGTVSCGEPTSGDDTNGTGIASDARGSSSPGQTSVVLVGDSSNGVPRTTITSVTCVPGIHVAFSFPSTDRFNGLVVYLVPPYSNSSGRVAVEAAGGLLYWAANTPQALPQTGSFVLQPLTLPSINKFAPGTIAISGTYRCD